MIPFSKNDSLCQLWLGWKGLVRMIPFSQNEDRADCAKCMGSCCTCLWSIAIVSLWIWGIVVIANKEVTGPPQIWYNETVSCGLVG